MAVLRGERVYTPYPYYYIWYRLMLMHPCNSGSYPIFILNILCINPVFNAHQYSRCVYSVAGKAKREGDSCASGGKLMDLSL